MNNSIDNRITKILVLGASITDCPWYTWKDFVEIETGITVKDLSSCAVGNEYMLHSLAQNQSELGPNTMVLCMLTNFDKFDWYVSGTRYHDLIKEKRPPKEISPNSGFWCTGSWFPREKEVYKTLFYSEDYFCTQAIQQILAMQQLCQQFSSKLFLFFDSPIWTLAEQTINNITPETQYQANQLKRDFLSLPLSKAWMPMLNTELKNIDGVNLLEFCWQNQLPWLSKRNHFHPPSSSHWAFYNQIIKPKIEHIVNIKNVDLSKEIKKFDQEWTNY